MLMAHPAVPALVIAACQMATTHKVDTAARPSSNNIHPRVKATSRRVRLKVKDTLPRAKAISLKVTLNSSLTVRRLHP
jgi:hypothetical protein